MCKLKVDNIGAIEHVSLDLRKITMILGPQSSGKSTIGKVLCYCQWVEKRCYNNFTKESQYYSKGANFAEDMMEYHRMNGYVTDKSSLLYIGNFIIIEMQGLKATITLVKNPVAYTYPKICYFPAERNIMSALPNINKYNNRQDAILSFSYDWVDAKNAIQDVSLQHILDRFIRYHYDKTLDRDVVYDGASQLDLMNTSSGVQSVVPMYLVLRYMLDAVYKLDRPLTSEQRQQTYDLMDELEAKKRFAYKDTHVYLEEPEQNLFPDAQFKLLYWLVAQLKKSQREHAAVITTHSPFILFALNNCMIGGLVGDHIPPKKRESLVSQSAWIDPHDVRVFEIKNGRLKCIQDNDGLLDNNYLNRAYKQISNEFMKMLTYYEDNE